MRKRSLAVAPALPTAALAISHSSVKPARKNTEVEALPQPGKMHDELLKEVVLEARAFSRPELRERQDSEQQPASPATKPQADTKPLETKSEEELVLLRKIVSEAKVFRRPSAKTGARSGCKVAANVRNGDQHGPRWVVS